MKRFILLTMLLGMSLMKSVAQKAAQYQDSYNFKRAMEIIQAKGDSNDALRFLQQELADHPKNGYAYYVIGRLYSDNDMTGDALEPTNKAISLLQKDKEWLTFAYRLRAEIHLKLGSEVEALNDWSLSLKADSKDVNTLSDRAEYYYLNDRYSESDKDYDRICTLMPGSTLGYMGLGRNASAQGKYDEAIGHFTYCIRLDPSYSQAYAFRAEAYQILNRVEDSVDDIIAALNIDINEKAYNLMLSIGEPHINTLIAKMKVLQNSQPTESSWGYLIGCIYERQEKYMKAIESYSTSLKVEDNDVTYYRIANCYEELGDFDLALQNIERAMELDPNDDDYVSSKADLLYDMGRGQEAIETYTQYISLNPGFWGGYYRRGFLKDNLKDIDGAIEDYTSAIVLNPSYAYAYLGRADKYMLTGNREAAYQDYQMVIALDTILGENNCAQYAYLGLGDAERAKTFEYAILAHSPSAGNYYDAACLFARMGEKETSLNFLKNSFEKGFRRFSHIRNDDDLDDIRDMDAYKKLMEEYESKYIEEQKQKRFENESSASGKEHVSEIPFTVESGNCYVRCNINDLPMRFVFDTGASIVSMSMVEASFMMKNGYLTKKDVVGSQRFSDAQGNVNEGTVINLRKVQFGDVELENVRASVVRNQKAPLLLGQSVLSRIGRIEIDNQKKMIVVRYMK